MTHPDYNSPVALKNFLDENGLAMQKKFGQNFLVNEKARKAIIDGLDVGEGTTVWEVGPGLGAMTDELLRRGAKLTAFEIDYGFARFLPQFFSEYAEKGSFSVVEGDVLKTWKKVATQGIPARFFGNLPYNIAATIMVAKPASADYSSFSVLCQWAYDVKTVLDLAGGNFWPKPNVVSRAVLMTRKADFPRCKNPQGFMRLIRALFASRRKTVRNNLLPFVNDGAQADKALLLSGIAPTERAENLSVEKLLSLSDAIESVLAGGE